MFSKKKGKMTVTPILCLLINAHGLFNSAICCATAETTRAESAFIHIPKTKNRGGAMVCQHLAMAMCCMQNIHQ